jgi:hypothetical protein
MASTDHESIQFFTFQALATVMADTDPSIGSAMKNA